METIVNLAAKSNNSLTNRESRFVSHAIVEMRKFKHLPFYCHSAVLLDLSPSGFKLEFTGETQIEPGDVYWLQIPLSSFGIYTPKSITVKCQCRWFDFSRYRVGGAFLNVSKRDLVIIESILENLTNKSGL